MEFNDSPETGQAVIWGQIITYSTNKEKKELEKHLEQEIKHFIDIYSNNPNEQTQNELQDANYQLDKITNKKTNFWINNLNMIILKQ